MADNLKYNEPGSGPLVATDDVGSVQFQKMKLDLGGDGVSRPVDSTIPVTIISGAITSITNPVTVIDTTRITDNTTFTDGTNQVIPAGYYFDEVAGTALTENDLGVARMDSKRAIVYVLEDETTRGRRATITAGLALKVDGSGANQPVTTQVPVIVSGSATLMGYDDLSNSTSTTLGSNAVFSGVAFDTLNYPSFVCLVASDQNSATGGLSFQWSQNALNWDVTSNSDVVGGTGRGFHVNHRGRYFRVVYTNGGTVQVQFRLDIIHRMSASGLISRPLDDVLNTENFAQPVRAVENAQKPDTTFDHLQMTASKNLKISIDESNPGVIFSGTVVGNVPHDAIDVGNPIKMGGFIHSGLPVAAVTGDRGNLLMDVYGRPRIRMERAPILGNYKFESGRLTIQSAAHGSTAGFFWLINPVGSTVVAAIKKMFATSVPTSAATFATAPRVTVERITFTGSASGATITAGLRDSKDAAPICSIRTASTGMVITAGAALGDFTIPLIISGASQTTPVDQWFYDSTDEDDYLVLRAGEGIVIRQPDAGSPSDSRLLVVFGSWEEK